MCMEVVLRNAPERRISTIGELAGLVGGYDHLIVSSVDYPDLFPLEEHSGVCLCPVDVPKVLEKAGFSVSTDHINYLAEPAATKDQE